MIRLATVCLTAALAVASVAQEPSPPKVDGIVTSVVSATEFEVNGTHVVLSPAAPVTIRTGDSTTDASPGERTPHLGQHALIFGKSDSHSHALRANRVELSSEASTSVATTGIIEAVLPLPAGASPSDQLIRASGYLILTSSKTVITALPKSTAAQPLRTNLWVAFHGRQRADGVVLADKLAWSENRISEDQKKLSEKTDYDPSAVDPDTGQNLLSKSLLGINPKLIPPYEDHDMQARVTAIGEKLVPKYQLDLPATDPTRINFRFQLIDERSLRQPLTLGSGIILVPYQLVDRMQNDSQVAALLAYGMAVAIEKQTVDPQVSATNLAVEAGLLVGGVFLTPLAVADGIAQIVSIPLGISAAARLRLQEEMCDRVSLDLLHNAGFDINEAPRAWWLIKAKKKDLSQVALPRRTTYLYQALGTTWNSSAVDAAN